jgi:hypothetical protein
VGTVNHELLLREVAVRFRTAARRPEEQPGAAVLNDFHRSLFMRAGERIWGAGDPLSQILFTIISNFLYLLMFEVTVHRALDLLPFLGKVKAFPDAYGVENRPLRMEAAENLEVISRLFAVDLGVGILLL